MKYINIAEPLLGNEEWNALKEPILSGWLTQGPKVKEFEEKFAQKHAVQYAYAVTSCTTALHLALAAIGVKKGYYIVVPSLTWIATANAVEYCGATPIFCDNDINTYNIDVKKLADLLEKLHCEGKKVKAIIPVHLFGLVAEMTTINYLAKKYGAYVIEDAACAAGALYDQCPAGSLGDIACFSFHPRKIITTGEGGMCTTNNIVFAEKISRLRSHGASLSEEQRHRSNSPYLMPDFDELGYNYRMSDLQGAVGSIQIEKLEGFIKQRREWAAFYDHELRNIEWLITPSVPEKCQHSYQAYVCRVDVDKTSLSRNQIMQKLHEAGIGTRAGTHAVHQLGYYKNKYHIIKEDYPVATLLYANTVSLPLHNKMTKKDFETVVTVLKKI